MISNSYLRLISIYYCVCLSTELITDGETGLLTPPRDAAATAEAIKSLLEDPEHRDKLAAAGRKHVTENLTPEKAVDKLKQVFQETMKHSVRRGDRSRSIQHRPSEISR